jgi:4-amino-4-deoxy-L-arabinose transferase-like glycosyltransferase
LCEKPFSKIFSQKWVQILFLLGFCFFVYFFNLGRWDLWNPDEPRYAQVAKEMVAKGDWVLMHYNGRIYPDKPPLFFWLIGLSSYLWQGFSSLSVRFIPALFGTLTVLITFFIGKTLFSSRAGFLSGLILATSYEFAYLSTRANIDTTLTFFTTASLLCFFLWYRSSSPNSSSFPKNLSIYGFYIGMAFATLAKGPVGFILPLLVTLLFLLVQRDWRGIKAMRLLPGMILFLAIVLAWYLPAVLRGGDDYLNATLMYHSIERFEKGVAHIRPIYYYFYQFPLNFFPWTIFLPATLCYIFSKKMMIGRKESLFLTTWFVIIFLFFTLSRGKRGLYLLPLYPPVSLMVGELWDGLVSGLKEPSWRRWISYSIYGFVAFDLIGGIAIPFFISIKFPGYLSSSLPIAFIIAGGGIALLFLYRSRYYMAIFLIVVGITGGCFFYLLRVVFPTMNQYKSARFISQELTERIQPGESVGIYGGLESGPYNYYTGIVPILVLEKEKDFTSFMKSDKRVFCFLKVKKIPNYRQLMGDSHLQEIAHRGVGDDKIVLLSNR